VKITIESTDQLTHMDGVPVRVWKGVTERGTECFVFVHRVAVRDGQHAEFARELNEQLEPGRVIDAARAV
jgi:hypothetical protein